MSNQRAHLYNLIKRPIVSEKTTAQAELGQYVFEVDKKANKVELTKAFELAFPGRKVNSIRLINMPGRAKRMGRHQTQTRNRRKAVFAITGDPIELFSDV